jgi:hypothetical protein
LTLATTGCGWIGIAMNNENELQQSCLDVLQSIQGLLETRRNEAHPVALLNPEIFYTTVITDFTMRKEKLL